MYLFGPGTGNIRDFITFYSGMVSGHLIQGTLLSGLFQSLNGVQCVEGFRLAPDLKSRNGQPGGEKSGRTPFTRGLTKGQQKVHPTVSPILSTRDLSLFESQKTVNNMV